MRILKFKIVFVLAICFCFFFIACPPSQEGTLTIGDLKGPNWREYIGKKVSVEGIFVRDSVPMLVTDLKFVLANMPMPEKEYILLVGQQADSIDPKDYGGARLKVEGSVKAIEDSIKDGYAVLDSIKYEFISRETAYYPVIYVPDIHTPIFLPRRYAVLFSGGINYSNNWIRYWNDLVFMYSTLINKYGYTDETIFVLYANGVARNSDMVVDFSATQPNLESVFDEIRDRTTNRDFIFLFTTNHGGGFWGDDPSKYYIYGGNLNSDGDEGDEALFESIWQLDINGDGDQNDKVAWDESLCGWYGNIRDDNFEEILRDLEYNKMTVVMEQCFSGGLIYDMVSCESPKIAMSAAGQYEPSWSMSGGNFDEFCYYFTCAINQADHNGAPLADDPDENSDGKISMVEAFNYARQHDSASETPYYEDNGDGVPHAGQMPNNGEGELGAETFLN